MSVHGCFLAIYRASLLVGRPFHHLKAATVYSDVRASTFPILDSKLDAKV